ncbi:MAG: hypothetical protein Q4F79_03595 [Eubacteriales bacterium]|nr:hypothetical protein [Eubacteriales bacterium]
MKKKNDKLEYKNPYGEIEPPDRIPLNPNLTEEQRFKMPALRFYCMILGFCLGMILFSLLRMALHLTISVHWTFVVEILVAAVGWALSKYVFEPKLYIPYEDATAEEKLDEMNRLQRKQDEEEAEMKRLLGDQYLSELRKMEEQEAREAAEKEAQPKVDRAVFDDEEPLEEETAGDGEDPEDC